MSTQPEQWRYVPTEQNPADHDSRSVPAACLAATTWLSGPTFLCEPGTAVQEDKASSYDLVEPESDVEVRSKVKVLTTEVTQMLPISKR